MNFMWYTTNFREDLKLLNLYVVNENDIIIASTTTEHRPR